MSNNLSKVQIFNERVCDACEMIMDDAEVGTCDSHSHSYPQDSTHHSLALFMCFFLVNSFVPVTLIKYEIDINYVW